MKHLFFPILAAASLLLACGDATQDDAPAQANSETADSGVSLADGLYVINKVKPRVTWSAQKLTGEGHEGTLAIASGKFKVTDGAISEGVVVFDMSQIEVTDMAGDSKASLEGHLRSGDFFNVEEHPQAFLNVSGISTSDEGGDVLNGTLTLNGKSVDYSLPVTVTETEVPGGLAGLSIQGKFNLDRTKHDIVYRSKTFDDKLDWFIKDDVSVGFAVIGVPAN